MAFAIGAALMFVLAFGGAYVGDPTRPRQDTDPWRTISTQGK